MVSKNEIMNFRGRHFLMIKSHNKTGMKYLCKCSNRDPLKYSGSGIRWLNHIKKYGKKDISTKIIKEFSSNKTLSIYATKISEKLNVVEDEYFANLTHETGGGGSTSETNAMKKLLKCPWCGETGYGEEFRKIHLVTTRKTKTDKKRYNCPFNPNKRYHHNEKFFTINNEKFTINELSEKFNLTKQTITQRLLRGWVIEDIIKKPSTRMQLYELGNEKLTVREISEKLKVSTVPIYRLIRSNFSIDDYKERLFELRKNKSITCYKCTEILTDIKQISTHFENCSVTEERKEKKRKKFLHNGELLSLNKISKIEGINLKTLEDRIYKGKDITTAIKMGKSNKDKKYTYQGIEYSSTEIMRKFNIASTTFYRNINKLSLSDLVKNFGNGNALFPKIEFNGKEYTRKAFLIKYGISEGSFYNHKSKGLEYLVHKYGDKKLKPKGLSYDGEHYTVVEFCKKFRISIPTYYKYRKSLKLDQIIERYGKSS